METISSSSMPGKTHSFLDQTPEPYGHDVLPTRSSNNVFQYSVSRERETRKEWTHYQFLRASLEVVSNILRDDDDDDREKMKRH